MSTQDLGHASPVHAGANRRRKPIDPQLLEHLAETGFLATEFGMDEHAERIFLHLAALKPGKPSPRIALAMVQARRGHIDAAISALRELIDELPECDLARAVLGTMLVHVGNPEALTLFQDVIARATDPSAVSVAESCLDLARAVSSEAAARDRLTIEFFRHYNIRA